MNKDFPAVSIEIKERIRANSNFRKFAKSEQNRLTSGQSVFVNGLRGAIREVGFDVNWYDYNQSYFSSFIHAHPISFMRTDFHKMDFQETQPAQFVTCMAAFAAIVEVFGVITPAIEQTNREIREREKQP